MWLILATGSTPCQGQFKQLSIDDMANWMFISKSDISPNGKWVSYEVKSEEGDPSVHFYEVDTKKTYSFPTASDPRLSVKEDWAVFKSHPPKFVVKELKRKKVKKEKMPTDTLVIFNFEGNQIQKFAGVKSISIPDSLTDIIVYESTAPFIAADSTHKDPYKKRNDKNGYHLIVRQISTGIADTLIYTTKWKLSEHGKDLIAHCKAQDSTEVDRWLRYDLQTGLKQNLYSGKGKVEKFGLSPSGNHAMMIIDHDTTKAYQRDFTLHVLGRNDSVFIGKTSIAKPLSLDSTIEVNPLYMPHFSEDGRRLFYKYRKTPLVVDTALLDEEKVDVEIWTTSDPMIYPQQEKNVKKRKKEGQLAQLYLSTKQPLLIGDDRYNHYTQARKSRGNYVLSYHNESYLKYLTWEGHDFRDFRATDLRTGESWKVIDSLYGYPRFSPSGNWAYWWNFQDTAWVGYDLNNRKMYQWTNNDNVSFSDENHDYPALPWHNGMTGFSEDEKYIYINDRYDIWKISTTQTSAPERLTDGRKMGLRHRRLSFYKNEEYVNDSSWLVYLFNENNKKSGYSWLNLSDNSFEKYHLDDFKYSRRPKKALNKELYLYSKQDYNTYPDLILAPNFTGKKAKQITEINPQQVDYHWGRMILLEWKVNGEKRQGMVAVPKDFDPSKKYPLIVNFYEKSSDNLHNHRRPYLHRSTINYPLYTSNGYIIFNPDVNYAEGDPGLSATETVLSGVHHLLKQGFIDKSKMALQGHSWGGYQIAHILTKTNLFACAESGAPVVNMTSAYGGVRWGSGMSRMFQYEKTQSRLGATLWEDPEVYMRNSPLFNLDKVTTPVLILHNDQDGAVPWYQGIEYYMGLRRLGKKAWLLNYRGEPHWPLKLQNRKDFQTRMFQFFNHYLKGDPMPEWMEKGIPAHERGLKSGY